MACPESNRPEISAADLEGVWQCFQGDGIHGWDSRVLVFRNDGNHLIVESWLPFKNGKPIRGLHLWGTETCTSSRIPDGIRLTPQKGWEMDISPELDGTFLLSYPDTTAGGMYFRRSDKSVAELSKPS